MSLLNLWVQSASAKAVGGTLLHSLWEGAAAALVVAIVMSMVRSPRVRYATACLAMLGLVAGFGVTLYRLMPPSGGGRAIVRMVPAAVSASPDAGVVASRRWEAADLLPWLAPVWIAGVLLFQLRCLAAWMAAARLRRIGVCGAPYEWFERLDALRVRLRMTRPVTLLESCLAEAPAVIGHLRPVILVPVGLLAGLPIGQVEAILLHELAHIRRADYLVNVMQTVVEGLLFYHPAVWWISAVIRAERENCCDDVVVATSGDAHEYATALAALATNRWTMRDAALAATGGNLVKRIRRLLAPAEGPRAALAPLLTAGILIVTCGVALAAWQPRQSAPAIVPVIPVAPAPLLEPAAKAHAALAQPMRTPTADSKSRVEALEKLRETMQKLEAKSGAPSRFMMTLAQASGREQANPAPSPYQKWLEEVSYIITTEERKAFKSLATNDEREMFIKQFWARRDPAYSKTAAPEQYPIIPRGNAENAYREEFYRRIAYANDRFGEKKAPGWKTDRGRIYITYGPPDEIDSHPAGGAYTRPPEEGGGPTTTYPFEQWRYRFIDGIGANIIMEFVDRTKTGEYRMTMDPSAKDALLYVPKAGLTSFRSLGGSPQGIVEITPDRKMVVTIPIAFDATQYLITESTVSSDGKTNFGSSQTLASSCKTAPAEAACLKDSLHTLGKTSLPSGSYTFTAVVKDTAGATEKTYVVNFFVN